MVSLAVAATSAIAADLPSRRAPSVLIDPTPVAFSWTGFHIGANAGYAFDNRSAYALAPTDLLSLTGFAGGFLPTSSLLESNGFTGGGQVGYDYALPAFSPGFGDAVVVGVEADAAYTDLGTTGTFLGNGFNSTTFHERTEFVGTVRGRIGLGIDRTLLYATGGFAYGGVADGLSSRNFAGTQIFAASADKLRSGYVVGGGIEYALPATSLLNVLHSSTVTVKGEFLHYDFGTRTIVDPGSSPVFAGSALIARVHTDGDLVRAGLNFKFGGAAPLPVVARY